MSVITTFPSFLWILDYYISETYLCTQFRQVSQEVLARVVGNSFWNIYVKLYHFLFFYVLLDRVWLLGILVFNRVYQKAFFGLEQVSISQKLARRSVIDTME